MWFEHAVGKEKIKFMFNNDFPLFDLELISFSFNVSSLRLSFSCKNIPVEYPKKWDRKDFNSLLLGITLTDVIFLKVKVLTLCLLQHQQLRRLRSIQLLKLKAQNYTYIVRRGF